MITEILHCDDHGIERAAKLLRAGAVVAIPTETVYGLAANALDAAAVSAIFKAKDRPADNPLITHIADVGELNGLAADVPKAAKRLMEAFWPGPLTLILRRGTNSVPDIVTAGLDTFAVRMPSHPWARALIARCGFPLAAPSANRSGKPSPTTAAHVYADMEGRIPLILDGGSCDVGLESTVVDVTGAPTLLRPGGVTREAIEEVLGASIVVSAGVDKPLPPGETARSPGLLHRHYAPEAAVTLAHDALEARAMYEDEQRRGGRPLLLAACLPDGMEGITLGVGGEAAHNLFAALREADARGATRIIFQNIGEEGVGHAVMNRMRRAAQAEKERS